MPTPPFLLTTAQMRRLSPHFPLSHGIARVDDRRVLSGIIYVIRNGLQWRDAPAAYGPHKTLYNRFVRWSRMGVFDRIFAALSAEGGHSGLPLGHIVAYKADHALHAAFVRKLLATKPSLAVYGDGTQVGAVWGWGWGLFGGIRYLCIMYRYLHHVHVSR